MADMLGIEESRKCAKCVHRVMIYDNAFIVNGEHYYCSAIPCEDDGPCIDGYWYIPAADCPHYLMRTPAPHRSYDHIPF